jgi:hypothetical protein
MKLQFANFSDRSTKFRNKSQFKLRFWSMIKLSSCLILGLGISIKAPASADPFLTDADQFPHRDYPPTYPVVLDKVLDFTSNPNLHALILDDTFRDLLVEKQNNAFRAVIKDMWDMQTLSSQRIRTRDIASPFTTQLSCYSSYYRSSGIEVPTNFSADCPSTIEFAEVVKEAPVSVQPAPTPAPARRNVPAVPALW